MLPSEVIIIVGPTGVGKTELAIDLAKIIDGEIVGMDAFQIYRGIPILTGQPTVEQQLEVPHHFIGTVPLDVSYNAYEYQKNASVIIKDIISRKKVPILVGGTGLYLHALLGGITDFIESNPSLKKQIESLDTPSLFQWLLKIDPQISIDKNNRRRLMRTLELILLTNKPINQLYLNPPVLCHSGKSFFLFRDRAELNERIQKNIDYMFLHGVVNELQNNETNMGITARQAIGIKILLSMEMGEITLQESKELILISTRRYAKRQITWFKNKYNFIHINLTHFKNKSCVISKLLFHIHS